MRFAARPGYTGGGDGCWAIDKLSSRVKLIAIDKLVNRVKQGKIFQRERRGLHTGTFGQDLHLPPIRCQPVFPHEATIVHAEGVRGIDQGITPV